MGVGVYVQRFACLPELTPQHRPQLCVCVGEWECMCSTLPVYRAVHSTGHSFVYVWGSGSVCAALCLFTRAGHSTGHSYVYVWGSGSVCAALCLFTRAGHSTGHSFVYVLGSGSVCAALCLSTRADPSARATALCMCGEVGVYMQHFAC